MNNYSNVIIDIKNKFKDNGIILSFVGPFSQGIIEEIGQAVRNYLEKDIGLKNKSNSIFSIFIEQSQNIKNYENSLSEEDLKKVYSSSVLLIGEENGKYFTCSGNIVKKEDIDNIKNRLDEIKKLDIEEIKKLYKKILKEGIHEEKNNAGLGFLEMAKKATEIDYDFIKLEENYYYFILNVRV